MGGVNTDLRHNGNYSDKLFQEGRSSFYHSRSKDSVEIMAENEALEHHAISCKLLGQPLPSKEPRVLSKSVIHFRIYCRILQLSFHI